MDKEILKQAYKNTSPKLKQYIDSDVWDKSATALTKTAAVSSEYIDDLIDEILLTLLGLEKITSLKDRIAGIPGIDINKACQLDQNISSSIFNNFLPDINAAYEKNKNLTEEATLYELGDLPEEYRGKFDALPDDVREAISSTDSATALEKIGQKHKLHIDQAGELGTQTGLVMLGVLPPRDFVGALADKLRVTPEVARSIANDINSEIFSPIRESLKRIHHLEFSAEETKPAPAETRVVLGQFADKPKKDFDPYREPIE